MTYRGFYSAQSEFSRNFKACSWAMDCEPHEAHEWSAHASIAGELIYATFRCPGFGTYLAPVPKSRRDWLLSANGVTVGPYSISIITNEGW